MGIDDSKPFFSVIMACHNAASYIEEAIRSVLNQTIADWELIIVDDASNDVSYAIASAFSAIDQRIKVYRLDTNRGAGFSRNVAIEHATGRWFAILDADDLYLPDKLERQRHHITSCSERDLVLVGTGVINISVDGRSEKAYSYSGDSKKLKRNLYRRAKFPPHSSLVYRASAFKEIGGFNPRFLRSEDYDLWLRLSEKGEFSCLETPLIKYRVHDEGISVNRCANGYTQHMYGAAANVCWRLGKLGCDVPSQSDGAFNKLMGLTASLYIDSQFEKSYILLHRVKKLLHKGKCLDIGGILAQNPLPLLFLICERIGLIAFHDIVFDNYKHAAICAE